MKLTSLLILITISSLALGQETLILDKVKPYAWNSTVPAVIFRSNPNAGLPLVIYCHGVGEAGTDGLKLWNQGLPKVLKDGYRTPYPIVMVAPQRSSFSVAPDWLPYIIQDMYNRYQIDTTRIYITGVSAGGWGSWGSVLNVSEAFAKKIAAIVPLSASYGDANQANIAWFKTSKTAVWAIAGGSTADATEFSFREGNISLVNKVNLQVPNLAKMTVRPNLGHCCWTDIYNATWKDNGISIWDFLKDKTTGIVIPPVLAPVITSNPAPFNMYVMDDFYYKMTATNNPTRWDAFPLPSGLKIDSTGQITGKPTLPAITNTSITATNAGGSGSKVIQFNITTKPKTIDSKFTTEYFNPASKTEVILYTDSTYSIRKL